ncbi:MAG: hypothetical protein INR73_02630 [Williamsia sp.]|nr:hypothetical protein [Williamsia sp.]
MKDNLLRPDQVRQVYTVLRMAVAMCFIGHGAFGILTKPIWCNYFAVVGIGPSLAYRLMPLVGSLDILMGIIMLIYPMRIVPAWLIMWGLVTASMRPLSGEPFAELIERAGNFGAPLALLLLTGIPRKQKDWFARIYPSNPINATGPDRVITCLRIIGFLLLSGHGWLNLLGKAALLKQYTALGFADPVQTAQIIGILEIAGACMILIKPMRPLIFGLLIWKMGSELFYPQYAFFEWVERGGSYGTLLALWMLAERQPTLRKMHVQPNLAAMH